MLVSLNGSDIHDGLNRKNDKLGVKYFIKYYTYYHSNRLETGTVHGRRIESTGVIFISPLVPFSLIFGGTESK